MTRWYRRYTGTVSDPKIAEAALIAGTSKAVVIATWDMLLESAAEANDGGSFSATARNVAATLGEQPATVENVLRALSDIGMIEGTLIKAWNKRQFQSDSSTERSRKHRELKKKSNDYKSEEHTQQNATAMQRCATPPYTESDTEKKDPLPPNGAGANAPTSSPSKAEALEAFKSFAVFAQRIGLPVPGRLSGSRERSIRARLREFGSDAWPKALAAIEASEFLSGRREGCDFRLSLDWLIKPANFGKVIEGNYASKDAAKPAAGPWWTDQTKLDAMTPDRWRECIGKFANGTWPTDKLGPPPGSPKCVVPIPIMTELHLTEKYDHRGIAKGEWAKKQQHYEAAS